VTNDIANWLLDTPFAGSAILPISSVTGAGLPELIAALQAEHAALHSRSDERLFRLSVDR
jgi:selenocysteine-specific elongation factor